jgi:hypothetical protein
MGEVAGDGMFCFVGWAGKKFRPLVGLHPPKIYRIFSRKKYTSSNMETESQ